MAAIVSLLGNFFGSIFAFFANLIKENAYKLARFSVLIVVNTAFVAAFVSYLFLLLQAVKWVYDKFNEILRLFSSSFDDTTLALGFNLLKAVGVWDGLIDAFNFLLGGFVLLFSILVTKLIIKALSNFSRIVLSYIIASLK